MSQDRQYWNRKYTEGLPSLLEPDPFFLRAYDRHLAAMPQPARALDVAGGLGRHALHLARGGWDVTVVDISSVAIGQLGRRAAGMQLPLRLHVGDAAHLALCEASLDAVVLFYHLDRALFPRLVAALRPGGVLLCKARVETEPQGEAAPHHPLLHAGELNTLAAGLDAVEHEERPIAAAGRGVVEYVGRKP